MIPLIRQEVVFLLGEGDFFVYSVIAVRLKYLLRYSFGLVS